MSALIVLQILSKSFYTNVITILIKQIGLIIKISDQTSYLFYRLYRTKFIKFKLQLAKSLASN